MRRELRTYGMRSLGFFVVLEAMLVAAILYWPSFAENVGSVKSLAAPIPMLAEMVKAIEQVGVSAYVIAQHYFKGCDTLGVAAAVLFAMGAVAGEAQRGTMEIWLARPVTRTRLLTERYVLGLLGVSLPVFASSLTVPWLLTFVDETMAYGDLLRASLHGSLFLGAVYSITFLFSALTSDPVRIAFVMIFLTVFQFALYLVKTLTHYSLLRMADVETFLGIVNKDRLPGLTAGLAGVCVVCWLGSLWAFRRRVP